MKNSRPHSFSKRLSLSIMIISLFILLVTLLIADLSSHKLISEEATKSAENLLNATISTIEKELQKVEITVKDASWLVEEKKDDEKYLYHITRKIVEEDSTIIGSSIAFEADYFPGRYYFAPFSHQREDGSIESMQLGNRDYDYFYADWYLIPFLSKKGSWSEPYYDEGGGKELMSTYGYPMMDKDGHVYAIITGDISLDWVAEILSGIKPYPHSNIMITSRCGTYIHYNGMKGVTGETLFSTLEEFSGSNSKYKRNWEIANAMVEGEKGIKTYTNTDGEMSFAVYGPLSNGWELCITCDYHDILATTSKMHLILIIIGILGVIVMSGLCYLAIHKMTEPLLKISESAEIIAKGNFDATLPEIGTKDEIGQLRDSFEYMQTSLKEYITELKTTTASNARYENDLNTAKAIQESMLKKEFPTLGNIDIHAIMTPAREIGGDFYDAFVKDGLVYIAVGDVSGKGIPASLFMSFATAAFRLIAGIGIPLNEIIGKINDMITESNDTGNFITMFIASINPETGEFKYCNAGHNPIVMITPDGKASLMKVKTNLVTGLYAGFDYEMEEGHLEPGSQLILYTDGVTEAERSDKEQYGEERLLSWTQIAHLKEIDSTKACEWLYNDIKAFTAGNEQNDDITIMSVKLS